MSTWTAFLAMIVAHNEYPQTLVINGENINWAEMKKDTLAGNLTSKGKDDVARLIGSIYNFVNKIAQPGFTLITPLKNLLQATLTAGISG